MSAEREPGPLPQRAVALRYTPPAHGDADEVPRVVARGQGLVAESILRLAREHDVPVREDPDLLTLLSTCDVGAAIPAELYTAVAELLVWLQRTHEALGGEE